MIRFIQKLQRRAEFKKIMLASKPAHSLESKYSWDVFYKRGIPEYITLDQRGNVLDCGQPRGILPEEGIYALETYDPHKGLRGVCQFCGAWGKVIENYGYYPCPKAPFWDDPEVLHDVLYGGARAKEPSPYLVFA